MKPILFNTEMVRAILEGRKTVTRRLIKPMPPPRAEGETVKAVRQADGKWSFYVYDLDGNFLYGSRDHEPPCYEGDILYVRENWAITSAIPEIAEDGPVYMADFTDRELRHLQDKHFRWRPSIHMPRDLARIFLRVTECRPVRLQDITADEALREGVEVNAELAPGAAASYYPACFAALWDTTIPKHPNKFKSYPYYWKDNPWVWAVSFERCEKPEK